jgi:hypothetical protein
MEMNIRMLMTRSGHTRGSLVILSEAKDLALGKEMLRYAQHDTTGFASLKCIIGLGGCSATLMKK